MLNDLFTIEIIGKPQGGWIILNATVGLILLKNYVLKAFSLLYIVPVYIVLHAQTDCNICCNILSSKPQYALSYGTQHTGQRLKLLVLEATTKCPLCHKQEGSVNMACPLRHAEKKYGWKTHGSWVKCNKKRQFHHHENG